MKKSIFEFLAITATFLLLCVCYGCGHSHDGHSHGDSHDHHSQEHTHEHSHDHSHDHLTSESESHHDHHTGEGQAHTGCTSESHSHTASHAGHAHAENEIVFTAKQAQESGLVIRQIHPGSFASVIPATGRLLASEGEEQILVAPASGIVQVAQSSLSEGVAVRQGEALYSIEVGTTAETDPIVVAKSEYEAAEKAYNRAKRLREEKIISEAEFEAALLRWQQAESAWKALDRTLSANNNKGVNLLSPISGYLKQRLVSVGEYVTVGQPMAVVTRNRKIRLQAEVSERYFAQLPAVTAARFRPSYGDRIYSTESLNGKVLSWSRSSDGASHYVSVTLEMDHDNTLLQGSFVETWLLGREREGVLTVPVTALTEEQGLYYLYVQTAPEHYRKQEVSLGERSGDQVEIVAGLRGGENVVILGAMHVRLASMSASIPSGHNHAH